MVRTMSRLWSVNPGFDPQNVLTVNIAGSPAVHGKPEAVRNGFDRTMEQLHSVPAVDSVSVVFGGIPLTGSDSELPYWVEGRPKPTDQSQMDMALFYGVNPDYASVMRLPLLRGRFLSPQDNEKSPCAIAIDQEMARKAFGDQDP